MVATPRPEPGGPIESLWGGQVHDVAVLARGVIASGAPQASKGGTIPLDTIIAGAADMVDLATNEFVAPVAGVYELQTTVTCTGAARGAEYFSHVYRSAGKVYAGISATAPTAGATARRLHHGGLIVLAAGERIMIEATETMTGGSLAFDQACFRLIAQELG